jgi:hypothetical protein
VPVAVLNRRCLVVRCNSTFMENFGVSTGTMLTRLLTPDAQATLKYASHRLSFLFPPASLLPWFVLSR